MDEYRFAGEHLEVLVKARGAELCSLKHDRWGELLWQAEPIWPQHAPNLFPIVGQLAGDLLRSNGMTYHLTRHGFARRFTFTFIEQNARGCTLELRDDKQSRELYPFAFRLTIAYTLIGDTLTVTFAVGNPGEQALPASVGAHPAFRWPLVAGASKLAHTLEFSAFEPAPIRRLQDGLLKLETFPSPIEGRMLALDETLFAADAIILDRLESRSVRYTAPGAPAIDLGWDRFRDLGLWSKPGANFLCIEPWYGYASPINFDGPFEAKPGLLLVAPGSEETLAMRIGVQASATAEPPH